MEEDLLGHAIYNLFTNNFEDKVREDKTYEEYLKTCSKKRLTKFLELFLIKSIDDKILYECEKIKNKKKELIVQYLTKNVRGIVQATLSVGSKDTIDCMRKFVKNNVIEISETKRDVSLATIGLLISCGLVFAEKGKTSSMIHMPKEVVSCVKELIDDKKVRQKREIVDRVRTLLIGIGNAYGVIPVKQAYDIYSTFYKDLDEDEFTIYMMIIDIAEELMDHFMGEDEELFLFNFDIENPEEFYNSIQSRTDLDYRDFSLEEYKLFAESRYFTKILEYKQFAKFVQEMYDCNLRDEDYINDSLYEYLMLSQTDDRHAERELLADMREYFEMGNINMVNKFMGYIVMGIRNNYPRWELKGHTPNEIFMKHEKPKIIPIKIGRNDLCSCGSGKKYKNCCGR